MTKTMIGKIQAEKVKESRRGNYMKIAVIGDIHCHNWKDFSKTVNVHWDSSIGRYKESQECDDFDIPMNSRLLNILNGLGDVRDYCVNNSIKLVLFAGDLFHSRGSVETTVYNATYKIFETFYQSGIEVIMISGNHDQPMSMVYSESSLYPFNRLNQVILKPKMVTYSDGSELLNIICIPYSKDKKMNMDALHSMLETSDDNASKILLAHVGISGGLVGSGNFVMSDEYNLNELKATKFKYCIFGHYHKPQVLEYNSIYAGSLLQNTFNDEGDKHGFWVIDTNKRWDMELIPLDYPEFITIKGKDYDRSVINGNYVRIQANSSDMEDIMSDIESNDAGVECSSIRMELEKDYTGSSRSDISIVMSTEDILKTYVRENNNTGLLDEELIKRGLSIYNSVANRRD